MKLLYPNAMLSPKEADDIYNVEYLAAKEAGLKAALFSLEGLQMGKRIPPFEEGEPVLYRGWMMTPIEYTELCEQISRSGGVPVVSQANYESCHYLPSWLPKLLEMTAETLIFPETADLISELHSRGWNGCFLKDYVKSLQGDSLITDLNRIPEVIAKMKRFRGRIEGGLCARRLEDYDPASERRHFVFRGTPHSSHGNVPHLVQEVARRIESPFYSVDTIMRRDGVMRVVEIGDGQVSDLKEWTPQAFVALFA
jgi:ATP-grasp domain, R2K clade family 3